MNVADKDVRVGGDSEQDDAGDRDEQRATRRPITDGRPVRPPTSAARGDAEPLPHRPRPRVLRSMALTALDTLKTCESLLARVCPRPRAPHR